MLDMQYAFVLPSMCIYKELYGTQAFHTMEEPELIMPELTMLGQKWMIIGLRISDARIFQNVYLSHDLPINIMPNTLCSTEVTES